MTGRTMAAAVLGAAALVAAGCGESEPEMKVGACTTADPKEALSLEVKPVDCDDDAAKSKIVREVEKSDECDVASVTASEGDRVFCTEPYPPGSAPVKPAVGVCTTADPALPVSVNIRLVDCDDPDAKSRIVKRAKQESQCDEGAVRGHAGEVFCIEPAG